MKIALRTLQIICMISFLVFVFFLLMLLVSSHKIPCQTYLKVVLTIFLSIALYFYIGYFKRKKNLKSQSESLDHYKYL